jgi:monovalent cation:H+ antiporter-2, CPA2 family
MEIALLRDIIICGLALAVSFICQHIRIPTVVGFLLTGLLAGPHGLAIVRQITEVEQLAEIGVVCLLFTIGLEFSLKSLLQIKFLTLVGGSCQVALTLALTALAAGVLGLPLNQAVFVGFLVSLSSTAIVSKTLQERGEIDSPQGRLAVGILLFQDIAVVPMMLVVPILAGGSQDVAWALLLLVAKGIAIIGLVIVTAKWVVPSALYQVVRLHARELFILGLVFVGLGIAWLTAQAGLSLALGAFLAGLIVAESEFSHRALGNVLPFRDLFTSFFSFRSGCC